MTANNLLDLLLRLTLACSASILLALLLRRPMRALFGASAAWQLWLVVPAAMLAAALPSLRVEQQFAGALVPSLSIVTYAAPVPDAFPWTGVLLAAWLCGAIGAAIVFVRAQRGFVASLGKLKLRNHLWYADNCDQGPALLGLLHPKIVVPADFDIRYDAVERTLIIAHERRHTERRDPLANAVIALLGCVFWFNPLVHVAAARCRFDQELACDADVMQRLPGRIKAYAAAMLKTQTGGAPALATCHWQSSHPLKERIMNLNQPALATARRITGRILISVLLCTSAIGALAAHAETSVVSVGPQYQIALEMNNKYSTVVDAPGFYNKPGSSSMHVLAREGEHFTVRSERPEGIMEREFWVNAAGNGKVSIKMKLKNNDSVVAEPSLLVMLGEAGAVAIGGKDDKESYKVTITVKLAAKPAPGA